MPPRKRKLAELAAAPSSAEQGVAAGVCEAVAHRMSAAAPPGAPTLGRADSVHAQWWAQDAAPAPRRGSLASRQPAAAAEPPRPVKTTPALRAALSFAAARIPELQSAAPAEAAHAPGGQRGAAARARARLDGRLTELGLRRERVDADGNCQFRALAALLLGDAGRHADTRAAAVAALRGGSRSRFASLFDSDAAYSRYCDDMARPRTWGDELTLAAAADAYGVRVHVVQSTAQNWHCCYEPQPQDGADGDRQAASKTLLPMDSSGKPRRVFVAYSAPVHYDAIVLA
jgi:hypothetical protein